MLSLHPHQKMSANAVHLTFGTLHYCCVNSTVLRFLIQHLFHYRTILTAAVPVLINSNGQIPVKYVSLTVEVLTLPAVILILMEVLINANVFKDFIGIYQRLSVKL